METHPRQPLPLRLRRLTQSFQQFGVFVCFDRAFGSDTRDLGKPRGPSCRCADNVSAAAPNVAQDSIGFRKIITIEGLIGALHGLARSDRLLRSFRCGS